MPPFRQQVDPGIDPGRITPVSSPVDTFVHPLAGEKLQQLGMALSQISPDVASLMEKITQRAETNNDAAGRVLADKLQDEGETLASATHKGLIPSSANPWLMAGLHEQMGRNAADQYEGDLKSAVVQDPGLQQSTNLADYDAFAAKFKDQWKKDNIGDAQTDSHFDLGFQFREAAYMRRTRNTWAADIESKVLQQAGDATHAETMKHVQDSMANGVSDDTIAADLNTLGNDLYRQGRNGTVTNNAMAEGIADAALADPDNGLRILNLLKSVNGKDGALSTTVYGAKLMDQTRQEIINRKWQGIERDNVIAAQAHKTLESTVLPAAIAALQKDPTADMSSFIRQSGNDADITNKLSELQKNVTSMQAIRTNPGTLRATFANIWDSHPDGGKVTTGTIVNLVNARQLNPNDAQDMIEQIQRRDKLEQGDEVLHGAMTFPPYVVMSRQLANAFVDPRDGLPKGGAAEMTMHAQAMLIDQWSQLNVSGKADGMSFQQKNEWLHNAAQSIIDYEKGSSGPPVISPSHAEFGQTTAIPQVRKPAEPLDKRLPATAVISPDDISEFRNKNLTVHAREQMDKYHIAPSEQAQFFESQRDIILAQPVKKDAPKPPGGQ